jgi:hypothetical protein
MLESRGLAHHDPEALMFTVPKGGAIDNRPWKMVITQLGIDYRNNI